MSNGRKIADLIVGTNVKVTVVDSDLDNIIGSLKTRLDSDDAKLQSLDTAINQGLVNLADSDLITSQLQAKINSAVANIDSDSTAIQSANTQIAGIVSRLDSDDGRLQALNIALAAEIVATNTDISAVKGRMDSDDGRLQSLDSSITILNTRLDSDSTALSAAKSLIGQAVAGQGMADSDLKVVADLRNQLDSEIEQSKNIIVTYTNIAYRATAGQTTFSGSDVDSVTLAYTAGSIQVFLNGVKLEDEDYTATNGTSIVLAVPAQVNAELTILVPTLSSNYVLYVAPNWGTITTTAIFEGTVNSELQGETVALNADGTILAVGVRNAAVGSQANAGVVRVYKKSSGTWSLKQTINNDNVAGGVNNHFGKSLDISADNNDIVIGRGIGVRGISVWTTSDSGETWSQQDNFTASGSVETDNTGEQDNLAISDDGNYIVAGAAGDDDTAANAGALYVFVRSGTSWSQQQKIQASDAQDGDQFGYAVDISGDGNYIIAGAPYEDTGSGANSNGKAYIFIRSGTSWSQQAAIQPSDVAANDSFGYSVSIDEDGNTAVMSSNDPTAFNASRVVYIFTRSGTSWSQQAKLNHPNGEGGDNFGFGSSGHDISGDGNTVYIGSAGDDDNGNAAGRGFIFTRTGTSWSLVGTNATPLASTYVPGNLRGVEANDYYGTKLSISKDGLTIAGGNENHTNTAGNNTGAAYVMVPSNLA